MHWTDVLANFGTLLVALPAATAVVKSLDGYRTLKRAEMPENRADRALLIEAARGKQLLASLQKRWSLALLAAGIGMQVAAATGKLLVHYDVL